MKRNVIVTYERKGKMMHIQNRNGTEWEFDTEVYPELAGVMEVTVPKRERRSKPIHTLQCPLCDEGVLTPYPPEPTHLICTSCKSLVFS